MDVQSEDKRFQPLEKLEAAYRETKWLRITLKFFFPIAGAIALFVIGQLEEPPLLVGGLITFVVALSAAASAWWDEARKQTIGELESQLEETEALGQLFLQIGTTVSELVRAKSDGYIEAVRQFRGSENGENRKSLSQALESHDNFGKHVDRIVAVLYDLVAREFTDNSPGSRTFTASFFDAISGDGGLILQSYYSRDGDTPTHLTKGGTHDSLARDGSSLASLIWRSAEVVVLEDAEEALKQRHFASFRRDGKLPCGSIIGFPVKDPKVASLLDGRLHEGVIGVLCVSCDQRGSFFTDMKPVFEFILDTFATRILFEVRREMCQKVIVHGDEV